ncbi:ROK family protein [Faecalicatena sp. Marseille-Q4148]|nr:ROK family protein [Faecalicatena sp. Marseille-Q4148]
MKKYICIDIGGTAIKYGMVNEKGNILERKQMATEASKGGPAILAKAVSIVETFVKQEEISGICISTAGMVDVDQGSIFYSAPLIPDYIGTNFKKTMEERFHIPCEVENDVNCAGLAETKSGAAKGCSSALCLTIGTGIGGCIIIDGKVHHGFSGSACEVGYMHMFGSDFQTLGASSILTKKVCERHSDKRKWNGVEIFEAAKNGDEICIRAIDEMCDILGYGIANICYVLNPELVVLGGGIMAQEEFLRPRIQKSLEQYLLPSIAKKTKLAFASHQNNAGMLGAFYHFQERHGESMR